MDIGSGYHVGDTVGEHEIQDMDIGSEDEGVEIGGHCRGYK